MPAIPFALSIHHFISTVGADAGFAAIIGLAILVLLMFAQARETASLRQRAADAEDQLHRLELYVDQLARRSAPAPAPAPAPAQTAGRPAVVSPPPAAAAAPAAAHAAALPARSPAAVQAVGGVATIPAAPAGTAAPALSAATRLIPAPDPISIRALHHGADAPADAEVRGATAVVSAPSPPPSTAAGGANGLNGSSRVASPLGGAGLDDDPRGPVEPQGAAELPPRMRLHRAGGRAAPMAPRRPGVDHAGHSRIGRGAIAVITLLVAALVVVALLVLTGGSGAGSQSSSSAATRTTKAGLSSAARRRRGVVTVLPSSVTVAVLNGTSTSNLAHDVMSELTTLGFKAGPPPATAPDQTHATTIVGYLPGFRTDALAVAKSLKLKSSAVAPIDANDRAVACGTATTTCAAQVVTIVGADLQSAAGTTSGAAGTTGGSTATAPTGT
jgi:LytR cell envelope-related transcriptional attenuator